MFERQALSGRRQPARHFLQEKGGNVLAVPAFMAATTIMFARSSSSPDRGQTSALAVQPDARKASWRSMNSGLRPRVPRRESASDQALL